MFDEQIDSVDPIAQYPALNEAQRQRARETAKRNLLSRLGGEPRYSDYERREPSKYGPRVNFFGVLGALALLLASFAVSAIHIFTVGVVVTLEAGFNLTTSRIVAGSFVVLAEAALITFSLVPTLWNMPRHYVRAISAGIAGAALLAIVGNVHAMIPYTSSPFDWFIEWWRALATDPIRWAFATLPPFFVVLMGMALKHLLLTSSETRTAARRSYMAALDDWQALVSSIEDHEKWGSSWFSALWDEWVRAYGARYRSSMTEELKIRIVMREMDADERVEAALQSRGNFRKFQKFQKSSGKFQRGQSESPAISKRDVIDFLKSNPGAETLSGKEIAEQTGASEATVSRARRELQQATGRTNGHNHG